MPQHADGTQPESQAPLLPEQFRKPRVGRLKVGETLQPIRRTAQDLYLFRDDIAGRSALVRDPKPGEPSDDNTLLKHRATKALIDEGHDKDRLILLSGHDKPNSRQSRRSGVTTDGTGQSSHNRHTADKIISTDISCHQCGEISSPEWRSGPKGPGTLCNVCGLVYAKQESHRRRERSKPSNAISHRKRK